MATTVYKSHKFLLLPVGIRFFLFRDGIFVILGIVEYPGERVVVMRPYRVVLVVVAARTAHGEAKETARRDIDAVVPFVGPRQRRVGDVIVPWATAEKPEAADRL